MAPALFNRLAHIGRHAEEVKAPLLSGAAAASFSILFTALYVLPFYLSPTTRPSPTLSRDAPSVIRARIRFVTASVTISALITGFILSSRAFESYPAILHTLGVYPVNLKAIGKALLLTTCLFAGPIFEKGFAEDNWRTWIRGTDIHETLSSWIGWRNYIAGPLTEEILFRSVIVSLHTHTRPLLPATTLIFATPLYFGIAHVHHFYEYKLTHPFTPLLPALLRSIIQFAYTTVFGWYATFIFLRTGSLWAVALIHAQCNWTGLPRVWGRVGGVEVKGGIVGGPTRGKEDRETDDYAVRHRRGWIWTMAYYVLLVGGALAWWMNLWTLTEDSGALAEIRPKFGPHKEGRT